ncbi:glycoside hydrolase family 65 protein [Pseudoclavibacter sp. RFBA6]|uniref:glycoside hydrolase family 65 protein n=1 Tax=Pseudoclavibacter sp. RFBA6 TaxID=2080573 RepID=UPI000CE8B957|nr:glycosyl hydrolase family 65 protein [Pseudoclavibacter sp. RFBA6]PPG42148.1 family 65 glycosyl hydrolase [Pseudoclavibacter sp. RFBA6]
MTGAIPFDVAPWSLGFTGLDLDAPQLAHLESVFALSNGHIGWRANFDEGDPHEVLGTYLNGVFEDHPMPYAEDGYGYPDTGQSVVNVQNGQVLRLLVGDEPLDLRRGTVVRHEQRLDFRAGTLRRDLEWTSPAGRTVRVTSIRLVSLTHRSLAAVHHEVEALGDGVHVSVQSEVVANEDMPEVHPDQRVNDQLDEPFEGLGHFSLGSAATLVHRTLRSGISIAVAMDNVVAGTCATPPSIETETSRDLARTTVSAELKAGEVLEITKYVGHEFSSTLSPETLRDRAEGAVDDARRDGWERVLADQRSNLDEFWACADVEIDGSPRLQQATRFALFHVYQSAARLEARSVPGKGLTGAGYLGHTFWDFESYVLPFLSATVPSAAEQALRWRHSTLDYARERAKLLKLEGAAFAWRTIDGRESSGYWPASTAAFHVNADIAAAMVHHIRTTGDERFEREVAVDVLVETARLWCSLGRWDPDGGLHFDGVTGPDEYSALVDDNTFTNLMARLNLRAAISVAERHHAEAGALGVDDDEIRRWMHAADAIVVPFDERRGVHAHAAGSTDLAQWDFAGTSASQYPLQEHFPYFHLYRKQVIKQADLVLALYFAHEAFTFEDKKRAFEYSEALTVRDSSLSASVQSILAAEVGHLQLAADYLAEAATLDLDDLRDNTSQGLHMASLAGIWTAVTAGLGGLRESDSGLRFAPRLPDQLTRIRFGMLVQGRRLHVEIRPEATVYQLSTGEPLLIRHFDEELVLRAGDPVSASTPPLTNPGTAPAQPKHRAPRPFAEAMREE